MPLDRVNPRRSVVKSDHKRRNHSEPPTRTLIPNRQVSDQTLHRVIKRKPALHCLGTFRRSVSAISDPDVLEGVMELAHELLDITDEAERTIRRHESIHKMGDVFFRSLTEIRKYIKATENFKGQGVGFFVQSWNEYAGGLDKDDGPHGNVIRDFINSQNKRRNRRSLRSTEKEFGKYKWWLTIYAERCELVHSGLDELPGQQLWNFIQRLKRDINDGILEFGKGKEWALVSLQELVVDKFYEKKRVWRFKKDDALVDVW